MRDINRKRLEWCATAKTGDTFPHELFGVNSWDHAIREMALDALEEIQQQRDITAFYRRSIEELAGLSHERRDRMD
jgi:hypothetical protein